MTVVSLLRNVNTKPHKRASRFSVSLKLELLMGMQVKKKELYGMQWNRDVYNIIVSIVWKFMLLRRYT